jgi:hypothetical protein
MSPSAIKESSKTSHTPPGCFVVFLMAPLMCMSSIAISSGQLVANDGNSDWVLPDQEIAKILVNSFSKIPQVKSICALYRPRMEIWTILNDYDRAARTKVHEKELEMAAYFRLKDFAFRVTSFDLVQPAELESNGFVELYHRA